MKTTGIEPIVQVYDYSKVKEYFKIVGGFFFRTHVMVKAETIKNECQIEINGPRIPDTLFINGKQYKFTPIEL